MRQRQDEDPNGVVDHLSLENNNHITVTRRFIWSSSIPAVVIGYPRFESITKRGNVNKRHDNRSHDMPVPGQYCTRSSSMPKTV